MSGNARSGEEMALVDPMPVASNHGGDWSTQFGRYNPRRRAESPTKPPQYTLQSIAAILSTSPTGGFTYLSNGGNLYAPVSSSYSSSSLLTSAAYSSQATSVDFGAGGTPPRPPLKKSCSLPSFKRYETQGESSDSADATPGTLRKSKSVRFADSQGLPLVEAVHQLTSEDPSYTTCKIVPYTDEDIFGIAAMGRALQSSGSGSGGGCSRLQVKQKPPARGDAHLSKLKSAPPKPPQAAASSAGRARVFQFKQPGLEAGYFERVARDHVVLESVRAESRSIHGVIRVNNLCYSKIVIVRWTHDAWRTHHDTNAVFCANDGATDRFTFELPINGDDLSFCIWYRAAEAGVEAWDNNQGQNYLTVSR